MYLATRGRGPSRKSARGKKERRLLQAMANAVPSLVALDLMLDSDRRMTDNPGLKAQTRALILDLNPALIQEAV